MYVKRRNLNLYPKKRYKERVNELVSLTRSRASNLPKPISIEDMDQAMYDYFNEGKMEMISPKSKKKINVIPIFDLEASADFVATYKNKNEKGTTQYPFITVRRSEIPRNAETPSSRYIIPDRKKNAVISVPFFDGVFDSYEMYKVPQPVRVDMQYEINLYTRYLEDVNEFAQKLAQIFSGINTALFANGYPLPTKIKALTQTNDNSMEKESIFIVKLDLLTEGRIVDENEFENITPIKQIRFPLIPPSVQDVFQL